MTDAVELSKGLIRRFASGERFDENEIFVLQVLAIKPDMTGMPEDGLIRNRICLGDSLNHFSSALLIRKREDNLRTPKKNDVIQILLSKLKRLNGKFCFYIEEFRILQEMESRIGNSTQLTINGNTSESPTTPRNHDDDDDDGQSRTPIRPSKRPRLQEDNTTPTPTPSTSNGSSTPGQVRKQLDFSSSPIKNAPRRATMQIKDLNPFANNYTIKARVTHLTELKEYNNSRGSGHVFNATLTDESGEIQITGFNDVAKKFHPILKQGKLYFLNGAQIKAVANRNFNRTDHQYEVTLNANTKISEISSEDLTIPNASFNFIPIIKIAEKQKNDAIDTTGIVVASGDISEISVNNGARLTKKKTITIMDEDAEIEVTLWDKQAEKHQEISLKSIIALKCVKVSDWKECSLNVGGSSTILIDPVNVPEVERLKKWNKHRESNNEPSQTQSLTQSSIRYKAKNIDFTTISEIMENFKDKKIDKKYCKILPIYVTTLKNENPYYYSCKDCRRKKDEGTTTCRHCKKNNPNPHWRYNLRGCITDPSGYHWVTMFDEAAEKLLGISANDLHNLKEQDSVQYYCRFNNAQYTRWEVSLKVTREVWENEERLKFVIDDFTEIEPNQYIEKVSDEIESIRNFMSAWDLTV